MSLLEMLTETLSGDAVQEISRRAGADTHATSAAVAGALPVLLGALKRNASKPEGAAALERALARDHDGRGVTDLGRFLGGVDPSVGAGILKHVLGGKRSGVETTLGQMSGLDGATAGRVLELLAPVIMGALGRERRKQGLDAGGLNDLLGSEVERSRQALPQGLELASRLLDSDGDGQVMDDLARMGKGLLGGLLGGRR